VSNFPSIQAILVPQGAEYKAVCRGLSRITGSKPAVVPIPVGTKSVIRYLQSWQHDLQLNQLPPRVLVMGLCGSLNPRYGIGATVLYQNCVYPLEKFEPKILSCDCPLTDLLYSLIPQNVYLVKALTSDRLIHKASEKRYLAETYGADVVDMEGFAALEVLSQAGVAVAMLRVVSDNCHHDIADLTAALSPEGALLPLPLALGMIRQPIAAVRLIQGALRGLYVLQKVTTTLFSSYGAE
jgi:hypothetical protein